MGHNGAETDLLLEQADHGDEQARRRLLERHRSRLKRMVAVRMDRRLTARLDPSDVVQEALADAALDLPDYLRTRPMAFYPWLRQLAWDRLLRLHRHHIGTRRRNVDRERADLLPLPDRVGDGSGESAGLAGHESERAPDPPRAARAGARHPATGWRHGTARSWFSATWRC